MGTEDHAAELAGGLRAVISRLGHALRVAGARRGLTPTRMTAVLTLERHGPLRPSDLAARLSISAASMSRLTEALEEDDWVRRTPDPEDRRACLLSLSKHGAATVDALRREGTTELTEAIRSLSEEQRQQLAAALPVLSELADLRSGTPA
ncbi:MAG: MarR family winged helix-turn-helix transcriptional regulator [Marmoricola sp.]